MRVGGARAAAAMLLCAALLLGFAGCGRKSKPEPRWGSLPTAAFHHDAR